MKKLILRSATVAALAVSGSTNAYAACDGCVTAAIAIAAQAKVTAIGGVVTAVGATTSAVSAGFSALIKVIEGQVLPGIKGATNAITQMQKETSDAQAQTTLRATHMAMIADAERRYRITSPCQVIATSQGMGTTIRDATVTGATHLGGRSGAGTYHRGGGASSTMSKALDIAEGKVAAPAPEVTAALASAGACSSFVAAGSARGTACDNAGFAPSNGVGYQDADIRAMTLFDGPQKAGAPRRLMTIDADEGSPEHKAIAAFRRNLGIPLELRSLKPAEQSTEAGRRYLAVKDSFESRMSMADYPATRHVSMLRSNKSSIQILEQLLKPEGDPAFVGKYLSEHKRNWRERGISADELMNLEVERRYMNPDWLAQSHTGTPEWKAGEQLRLTALQNVLMWRLAQESRINGVILGSMVASQVRAESLPELKAAHAAALR